MQSQLHKKSNFTLYFTSFSNQSLKEIMAGVLDVVMRVVLFLSSLACVYGQESEFGPFGCVGVSATPGVFRQNPTSETGLDSSGCFSSTFSRRIIYWSGDQQRTYKQTKHYH